MNRIKFILFDIIPKVCRFVVENKRYPDDMPDYLLEKGLTLPDFCKLDKFTSRFLDYGHIRERHIKVLRGNQALARPLYPILFGSSFFDPKLKERDLTNIHTFLSVLKEEEIERVINRQNILQRMVPNLKKLSDIKQFIEEEIKKLKDKWAQQKIAVYFDKNVLFRFANSKVFERGSDPYGETLIERVFQQQIIGIISNDCVKAVYSHLRYNLGLTKMEGGFELEQKDCEKKAIEFIQCYLVNPTSPWKIITYTENVLREAIVDKKHTRISTLEDRLEFYTFLSSLFSIEGLGIFVTNDAHFFEEEVQKSVDKRTHDRRFHIIQTPKVALSTISMEREDKGGTGTFLHSSELGEQV